MASWDEVINGKILMGRSRSLFLALNAARRKREEEEERRPGVNPNMGRGSFQDLDIGKGPGEKKIIITCSWEEAHHSQHLLQ